MSMLIDDTSSTNQAAGRLRSTMAAVRVCFTWLGVRKTLSPEQKSQAAESFGAQREFLSAGKKLLDTSHPAFKAVTGVRNRMVSLWKGMSLPLSRAGHPADPSGRHRLLHPANDDAQTGTDRSRRSSSIGATRN